MYVGYTAIHKSNETTEAAQNGCTQDTYTPLCIVHQYNVHESYIYTLMCYAMVRVTLHGVTFVSDLMENKRTTWIFLFVWRAKMSCLKVKKVMMFTRKEEITRLKIRHYFNITIAYQKTRLY